MEDLLEEELKYYNSVYCLSERHRVNLMRYMALNNLNAYLQFSNTKTWSEISKEVLKQRQDRAEMYANLSEPTLKIAELMVSCPERFTISTTNRPHQTITCDAVMYCNYHKIIDGALEIYFVIIGGKASYLECEALNPYELLYLSPLISELMRVHEKEKAEKIKLDKENNRVEKRQSIMNQYKDL